MCCMLSPVAAQDRVEATVQTDVVSRYIWRGQDLGDVSLQPTLGLAYKGLSLAAWGSVGLSDPDDTKELDLTLVYKTGGLNIGVTYDFGPVAVQWFTNFAGNDGLNGSGKRAYSSYVEASAPFRLGGCQWTATVGAVPYATSFYADAGGFAVTNVSIKAVKDIRVTKTFTLPLFAAVSANPSTEKVYMTFGLTLRP